MISDFEFHGIGIVSPEYPRRSLAMIKKGDTNMTISAVVQYSNGECRDMWFEDRVQSGDIVLSTSVGVNGINEGNDVITIQKALNNVSLASGRPITPLIVDGICGDKTKKAIQEFQLKHFGWKGADGRVDPDQVTIRKLRECQENKAIQVPQQNQNANKLSSNTNDLEPNPYVMRAIYTCIPEAMRWIGSAKRVLDLARLYLEGRNTFSKTGLKEYDLVSKYFHIDKVSKNQAASSISFIYQIYINMEMAIGHISPLTSYGSGYFQEDPTVQNNGKSNIDAYTFYGGWTRRNPRTGLPRMSKEDSYNVLGTGSNLRQDTIFFATNNINHSLNSYTLIIVHELSHFVGPEIGFSNRIVDHSYRHRANFFDLNNNQATRTADCYAHFAGEAKLHREP